MTSNEEKRNESRLMKHDHSSFNGKFFHKHHKMKHVWLLLTQMMNISFEKDLFSSTLSSSFPLQKLMQCVVERGNGIVMRPDPFGSFSVSDLKMKICARLRSRKKAERFNIYFTISKNFERGSSFKQIAEGGG